MIDWSAIREFVIMKSTRPSYFDAFKIQQFERESEEHKNFVRSLPCFICGHDGPNEAHHHPHKGRGSNGWSDLQTVPLCRYCHNQAHTVSGKELLQFNSACDRGVFATIHLALSRRLSK